MIRTRLLFPTLFLLALWFIPSMGFAQSKPAAKKSKTPSYKVGFSGDPARKRGMEIGFDLGKKAGKIDKDQDLKPDMKRHEAYQKPETYFRSEYGSSANFTSGFRSGFSGGYQSAFGKKVNFSSAGSPLKSGKNPTTTSTQGGGGSSDAL